ncbi:hypothetical protein BH09PAT2_BH09PAT2_05060 [soil metagenome]
MIVFLIISIVFLSNTRAIRAAELPDKAIDIILDQTDPEAPTATSVMVIVDNPERYMITLLTHFFTVKEVDTAGTVLFEGQIKRYKLDTIDTATGPQDVEIPESPLTMDIPYFIEARKVLILNESGTKVLEIDLGQYSIGPTPTSAPRFAECNKCGYCKGRTKQPGNVTQCMECLYPDFVNNPDGTLAVDPTENQPVKPRIGAYFSQLGCVDVGLAGFTDPSASGGLVSVILSRLIFPITGMLSLIALIYGSFLVITAQNDADQLSRGRKWIYGAIIGVVFTFSVVLLVRIIGGDLLKIPGLD